MTNSLLTATAVVHTADLLSAATDVWRAGPSRPVVPVLGQTRVTFERNGQIHLTTTDFEVFTTRSVDAITSVAEAGNEPELLVLTVALKQALSKLDQKTPVELVVEDKHLLLVQGSRKVKLARDSKPLDEFPAVPEYADPVVWVNGRHLSYIAKTVSTMAGKDDMLPVLTATRIALEGGTVLTGQSTDRFRLAIADIPEIRTLAMFSEEEIDPASLDFEGLVPRFHVVGTMFGDDENVRIGVKDGAMSFVGSHTRLHIRLLDGSFPRLRSLTPKDPQILTTFDGPAFLRAIKFAEIAVLRNEAIRVSVHNGQVTLAGGDDEQEMSDTVPAEVTGRDAELGLDTGFNPAFLADIMKVFGKTQITMSSTTASKPSLFTSTDHPYLTTLLMPRRRVS